MYDCVNGRILSVNSPGLPDTVLKISYSFFCSSEERIKLSLTWPRRGIDQAPDPHCNGWSTKLVPLWEQEPWVPRVLVGYFRLAWLHSVHCRGEDFKVVQKKETLRMLLAEVGAEGLESMVTLKGGFYFHQVRPVFFLHTSQGWTSVEYRKTCRHDICHSSCLGTLSHSLTLHLK